MWTEKLRSADVGKTVGAANNVRIQYFVKNALENLVEITKKHNCINGRLKPVYQQKGVGFFVLIVTNVFITLVDSQYITVDQRHRILF